MRKFFILLFILFPCSFLIAQQWVTFKITKLPGYHTSNEAVFLTGSFNRWTPGLKGFQFENAANNSYTITISLPKGKHEFKITRGSWEKAESGENGIQTANRELMIQNDTTIEVAIEHWTDHFPKQKPQSTANKNVQIIDTSFFIPQLNRYRRVWIYLPDSYCSSKKTYPVIYMQDGQNVFDAATSFSGEWGVDESMDSLGKQVRESIIVAVDNGGEHRMSEYSPLDMKDFGKAEGDLYVDFLANTLRPFINRHYRTKRTAKNTFIAGSSMGGLISFYAILKYPNVFGGAGVFSPAFWVVPGLKDIVEKRGSKVKGKIYFFAGKQESERMVPDMLAIFEQLYKISKANMTTVIKTEGRHDEPTWRKEFPSFYRWIME